MIGWLLGLGIPALAALALFLLNPLAFWKLASSVSGWVQDTLRAVVEWFRKDHDWWKIGFGVAGIGFLIASFVAWDARKTIVVVREQCKAEVVAAEAQVGVVSEIAESNMAAVRQCKATLTAEVGKRQDIEKLALLAVANAQRQEAKAEAELAEWQRQYNNRPAQCDAALAEMERVCATVPDN